MKNYLKYLAVVSVLLTNNYVHAQSVSRHQFAVYGFIPYAGYVQNGGNVKLSFKQLSQYLLGFGIKNLDLIYEQKMLDYPDGNKENGVPNNNRIDSLAREANSLTGTPVSLDLEGWKRFDTVKTPARMLAVINEFKRVNKMSKVGLYATVPQNTYAYKLDIARYDKVNKSYAAVAAAVDYYSPSLYNYDGPDTVNWNKAAAYNMAACKKYDAAKPIWPYITPEVSLKKGITTMLTYDEMMGRLRTLYNLGASGVLIWTSSGTRDADGNKIYVDANSGWLKAVRDFMAGH